MNALRTLAALTPLLLAGPLPVEDIEPRRWTRLPIGTTVVGVGALQAHAVYTDPGGWWLAAGIAHDWGGASTVDGVAKNDDREDLLYGVSAEATLTRHLSAQIGYLANRAQAEVRSHTHNLALGQSMRF